MESTIIPAQAGTRAVRRGDTGKIQVVPVVAWEVTPGAGLVAVTSHDQRLSLPDPLVLIDTVSDSPTSAAARFEYIEAQRGQKLAAVA